MIATLWIGPSLGAVERACLRSMTRQGHEVHLYCYAPVDGVPEGIAVRDAAEVLPKSTIIRHWTGSVALFANRFRYELQRRALGTWLDCDAYLLKPLDMHSPYLMGEYEPGRINNGVLRLPPGSPLVSRLLSLFEEREVPYWLPLRAKAAAHIRLLTTGRSGLSQMPWGSAGPLALTALAEELGLGSLALPQDIFYPQRWQDAHWVQDPELKLEEQISERTVSVHLWNEIIKGIKDRPAAPGSFLARIQAEGA